MIYIAFVLALALAAIAGVQTFYLMFLQRISHYDKRRIEELERKLARAHEELDSLTQELEEVAHFAEEFRDDDSWPEIIDNESR
jgi:aminoglycoside phosphotransferase (APT) family kinase protein